ncbi:NAD(P)-dependent oxidoreductase [Microbacterium sp.]|uniref:NAD-dependent epimerase/dehydratase family protein n=1 Tax=Microbacterium sp. TaxID=51671 RepID=UPI0027347B3B|nr:NAD-dependent epimerase/dehydratase family protein [Microbacterium sp.]MDP3950827.1 NAD-dependent epimerase/dehydratase family protein [Microbacterium sp.]
MRRIVLLGGSGFVGSAVAEALADSSDLVLLPAPRFSTPARTEADLARLADGAAVLPHLVEAMRGADVVVNAAGNPDASSLDEDALFGANALLPAVVLRAAREARVPRVVHVSSAVVQNDKPVLDSSEDLRPFSAYSASKVMGEVMAREVMQGVEVVRYRPPSVHAPTRRVTRMIRRIAISRAASVASPGTQRTPQALLPNVAAAIAHLATVAGPVPRVVHHPSEGVTVTSLMKDLSGGRTPVRIPRWLAILVVRAGKTLGRLHRPTAANARRVELLWLGQEQDVSWLTQNGWTTPVGPEAWQMLARQEAS